MGGGCAPLPWARGAAGAHIAGAALRTRTGSRALPQPAAGRPPAAQQAQPSRCSPVQPCSPGRHPGAHMAMACSVLSLGSSPTPVVVARTLKGRSSPWCERTTHSCMRELCREEGQGVGGGRGCEHGVVGGWLGGWLGAEAGGRQQKGCRRPLPQLHLRSSQPGQPQGPGDRRPASAPPTPGPGRTAPRWRPPRAPARCRPAGTAPGSCAGSRCLAGVGVVGVDSRA